MPIVNKPLVPLFTGPILSPGPNWITPAGTLGDFDENTIMNVQLDATDPALGDIVYTLEAGVLPGGTAAGPAVTNGMYVLHGNELAGAVQTENEVDESFLAFGTNNGSTITTRNSDQKFGAGCIDNHNKLGYVQFPRVQDMGLTNQDLTIQMWIQMKEDPGANPGGQQFYFILSDFNHSTGTDNSIQISNNAVGTPVAILRMDTGNSFAIGGLQALVIDDWTHIAVVKHNTTMYFFVNGILQGSQALDSNTLNPTATKPLQLCASNHNGSIPWAFPVTRFNGYIDEFVIETIARWTTNFTPPSVEYGVINLGTQMLLHFDDNFNDDSHANQSIVASSAPISNATKKFGTGAAHFTSSATFMSYDANVGLYFDAEDFTVELWFYPSSTGSYGPLIGTWATGVANPSYWQVEWDHSADGAVTFWAGDKILTYGGSYVVSTGSNILNLNQWNHIAVSKDSANDTRIFINGIQQGIANFDYTVDDGSLDVYLGRQTGFPSRYINGFIDEVRVSKGEALYTSNFIPPTEPFSVDSPGTDPVTLSSTGLLNGDVGPINLDTDFPITVRATSDVTALFTDRNFEITVINTDGPATQDPYWNDVVLLMHMEGPNASQTFTDSSQSGHIMVPHVDAELSDTEEIAGLSSMRLGPGNWSRLVTPSSTDFSLAESNWTLELWHQFVSPHQDHRRVITDNSFISLEVTRGFVLYSTADGDWRWWIDGVVNESIGLNMPIDTWHHLAIVRDGTSHVLYHNGVAVISKVTTGAQVNTYLTFGTDHIAYPYDGYMDEIRYTKGISRYTSDFTPPVPPFPETD